MGNWCVLEDRICNDCGECLFCDLNPIKVCDNCGQCIATDADYRAIAIDAIILPADNKKKAKDPDKDKGQAPEGKAEKKKEKGE